MEKQIGHSYITLKRQSLQQIQHFSGIFALLVLNATSPVV
jgi:hypothetical protein